MPDIEDTWYDFITGHQFSNENESKTNFKTHFQRPHMDQYHIYSHK